MKLHANFHKQILIYGCPGIFWKWKLWRACKIWIWTSKIIHDLWLVDLFWPIKKKFHTPHYCTVHMYSWEEKLCTVAVYFTKLLPYDHCCKAAWITVNLLMGNRLSVGLGTVGWEISLTLINTASCGILNDHN